MLFKKVLVVLGLCMMVSLVFAGQGYVQDVYGDSYTITRGSEQITYNAYPQSSDIDSMNMSLVGFYGLEPRHYAMTLHGSYLYVDAQHGFVVFDVGTDPSNPQLVAAVTNGPWHVSDIVAQGDYLYVMQSEAGLLTFDISNPFEPQEVDRIMLSEPYDFAAEVVIANDVLCLAADNITSEDPGIQITLFSLDNPAHPPEIGSIYLPSIEYFRSISVIDTNLLLVAGTPGYLYEIDVSDPTTPTIYDECNLSEDMRLDNLFYDGEYALYTTFLSFDSICGTFKHRIIYDMTDFSNPVVIDSQEVEHRDKWLGLLGEDTLMMLTSGSDNDTLYFFDISHPGELSPIAFWHREPGPGKRIRFIDMIIPRGELLYTCGYFWGLHVEDRTDLTNIQDIYSTYVGAGLPQSISTPQGGRFFATYWGETGYNLYGFIASSSGQITPSDSLIFKNFGDIFCNGDVLGVGGGEHTSESVFFYDISVPGTFNLLGEKAMFTTMYTKRFFTKNNVLYLACSQRGTGAMGMMDISDPASCQILGRLYLEGECMDVLARGNLVYVTGENAETSNGYIEIYNFNGDEFVEVSAIELEEKGLALDMAGDILYVSRYEAMDIFDVSDSADPQLLGTATEIIGGDDEVLNRGGRNDDVLVLGDRAYVASDEELVAFDVSDPTSPTLVGYYFIPDHASWTPGLRQRLRAAGDYLYWSTMAYGICVIDPYGDAEAIAESPPSPSQDIELWIEPGFDGHRTIRYSLSQSAHIEISAYDATGRRVEDLYQGSVESGDYALTWPVTHLPAGVYFIKLTTENESLSERVVVFR